MRLRLVLLLAAVAALVACDLTDPGPHQNVQANFEAVEHDGEPLDSVELGGHCMIISYGIKLRDYETDPAQPDSFFLRIDEDGQGVQCPKPGRFGAGTYLSTRDSFWEVSFTDPTNGTNDVEHLPTGHWLEFGERFEAGPWLFERVDSHLWTFPARRGATHRAIDQLRR